MRMRRVRVPSLRAGTVRLVGSEAHHLARVPRVRPGDPVVVFDGDGREADGRVEGTEADAVAIAFAEPRPASTEPPLDLDVAVALLKGDKLPQVVRQATELGAARIRPFVSRRCDVPRLSPSKAERLRRVAAEAAKQSGRAQVPEIAEVVPFERMTWSGPAWIGAPDADRSWAALAPDEALDAGRLTLISGPEGGFAPDELEHAAARGAAPVRLGPRVLRAETAPVALLAAVLAKVDE